MTESSTTSKYEIRTPNAVVQANADHVHINAEAEMLILSEEERFVAAVPFDQLVYCIRLV